MQPTSFQAVREEKKREVKMPPNMQSHLVRETFNDFARSSTTKTKTKKKELDVVPPFQLDSEQLPAVRSTDGMSADEKKEVRFRVGGKLKGEKEDPKVEEEVVNDDDATTTTTETKTTKASSKKPLAYEPPWQFEDGKRIQSAVRGSTDNHLVGGKIASSEKADDEPAPKREKYQRRNQGGTKGVVKGAFEAKLSYNPPWQFEDGRVLDPVEGMSDAHVVGGVYAEETKVERVKHTRRVHGGTKGNRRGVFSTKLQYTPPWQFEEGAIQDPVEGMSDAHVVGGVYAEETKVERVKHKKKQGGLKGTARGVYGNSNALGADGKGDNGEAVDPNSIGSGVHFPWQSHDSYPELGADPGPKRKVLPTCPPTP